MIFTALSFIEKKLNLHLKGIYGGNEEYAILSNLANISGNEISAGNNKMVLTLTNVQKESVFGGERHSIQSNNNNTLSVKYIPLSLNLHLLISASFSDNNYDESLKYLSTTMEYFQANPLFQQSAFPDLDQRISQLSIEIESLSLQDQSHLYGLLGVKYLPSVLYKIRMITIDSNKVIKDAPIINKVMVETNKKL
jgi:hypothetical protein